MSEDTKKSSSTYRFIVYAIAIRILIRVANANIGEGEATGASALGAFVILRLWPHIMAQKEREKTLMMGNRQDETDAQPEDLGH